VDVTLLTMPGVSDEYRDARRRLLDAEFELRNHVERLAQQRRSLPRGPLVKDYEFLEDGRRVRLSELFNEGKPYLIMYHFMYWQDDEEFCPMCSMWVDGIDGVAHHVARRAAVVAATLAPLDRTQVWAKKRKWQRIRVLADADPSFARDSKAESPQGDPLPTILVFEQSPDGIRHIYTQHAEFPNDLNRGIDQYCATWHLFDLLPSGRGDWNAGNDYI
jgi:predicted dithiol-disulfide oxidoreductase (DUF899 family)